MAGGGGKKRFQILRLNNGGERNLLKGFFRKREKKVTLKRQEGDQWSREWFRFQRKRGLVVNAGLAGDQPTNCAEMVLNGGAWRGGEKFSHSI